MHSLLSRLFSRLLPAFTPISFSMFAVAASPDFTRAKPADVLDTSKVWEIHLRFRADQFAAMEPKGGGFPMGGGGGGRGGRGGFGPGTFLAPAWMTQGDTSKDSKLSKEEFRAMSERWFAAWDKDKAGKLNSSQMREGLNVAMAPPADGARGGPPAMNFLGREGGRNGLSAMTGVEFDYVQADLEFGGQLFTNVAVRYKGNGTFMESRATLKRSLKIQLDEHVKGRKLAGMDTLNLHNCVTDPSYMNEVLSHRLFLDAGTPAARAGYAKVYATVEGKYDRKLWGVYSIVENPDNDFARVHFGTKKGALFKPVGRRLFEDMGDDWAKYHQTYDPKTKLTTAQQKRVIEFAKLVSHASDTEFESKLAGFLDLDAFARFMAVTTWLSTLDSILGMGQNFLVYLHPETSKFHFIPWDLDHSFGQFHLMSSQEKREQLSIHEPWHSEIRFLQRVFKTQAFKKIYLARMEEFSKTVFEPQRFHRQVDEIASAIRGAVQEESNVKLDRFDKSVAGESVTPNPMGFGTPMAPRKPIKPFVVARNASVKDQLAGKSEGKKVAFRGFGGGGGGGRGGRGGGFGPGNFVAGPLFNLLDADKDNSVTEAEFKEGFAKLFLKWDKSNAGSLDEEGLKDGMNADLGPGADGIPGPAGSGRRGGPPPGDVPVPTQP